MNLVDFNVEAEASCLDESLINRICGESAATKQTVDKGNAERGQWKQDYHKNGYGGGKQNYNTVDLTNIKCYNCNTYGHFSKNCRKRSYNYDGGGKYNQRPMDDKNGPLKYAKR